MTRVSINLFCPVSTTYCFRFQIRLFWSVPISRTSLVKTSSNAEKTNSSTLRTRQAAMRKCNEYFSMVILVPERKIEPETINCKSVKYVKCHDLMILLYVDFDFGTVEFIFFHLKLLLHNWKSWDSASLNRNSEKVHETLHLHKKLS